MDEELLEKLMDFGMGKYEAMIYAVLFHLKFATARELYEITGVPRGKVYQTLGQLIEKRYVLPLGGEPMRYQLVEISETFDRIKKEQATRVDHMRSYLQNLEREQSEWLTQAHEIRTPWAIESRIQLLLRRPGEEMMILCNDPKFLKKYSRDLHQLSKKIHLYIIVLDPKIAEDSELTCYLGGPLLNETLRKFTNPEKRPLNLKLLIYADCRDSLEIIEENGSQEAIFFSYDFFSEFLYRILLREMRPLKSAKDKEDGL
ncbi:MAG: hypothetical protein O0V67_05050 [Methanocorpusculum sp.]|nr:hypothetical protein [Methanocorpusculum sp.]